MQNLFNDHAQATTFYHLLSNEKINKLFLRYKFILEQCNTNIAQKIYPSYHKKAGQKIPNNFLQMPDGWKANMKIGFELIQQELNNRKTI